ncbi:NAD(P)/FAD-dependent oxidoreductase [Aeromicrobium sp. Marseille-Q0843]|uniref:NAD(P)/FAD-dependent oxidoreductase n=1 Tax=Aeromicrobium phoceense TaxID=2754045 RepID=A0A838XQ33_9ACTN|nr:NAD(P)/FAD-dependent oxidoreductase [Aeromicrobium phoceense]MBA4609134.1 NAD(P)/FAD-dependent oxidoreductase [Aeromicrobium phoceense]
MADANSDPVQSLDALVVGLGFGGIYSLHKLRNELGLDAVAIDKAGGVGGTWYWNRYPGALSDSESFVYQYSFDRDLYAQTPWKTKFVTQPEILEYLDGVVDRYDLRPHTRLETAMTRAAFDDTTGRWTVETDRGVTYSVRFLVTGLGLLSATNVPDIAGIDTFAGRLAHTGAWPEDLDLTGKRVAVIGNGSTGGQVIPAIAPVVKHLTSFMRTPQYSVPAGNREHTPQELQELVDNFEANWNQVRESSLAMGFVESTAETFAVSDEEREAVFEAAWNHGGGFRFMFETFGDIATDPEANEAAASFIRRKIAQIVKDPETARRLTPTDLYAKRPLCDSGLYETFNRDNVSIERIDENPIERIVPEGILTADGVLHELDVIILATGFDAVDGNYRRTEIRGRDDVLLADHWADGPTSYLGMATTGFPNMFMILGPNGPFTNLPPSIEVQVEWISDTIGRLAAQPGAWLEVRKDIEHDWTETCADIADATLFPKAASWIFGANIPGKRRTVMFYLGGLKEYRGILAAEAAQDFPGFALHAPAFVTA